jgi:hypothetical protein
MRAVFFFRWSRPMADKRKKADDRITVRACAGFRHDGKYIRAGETVEVSTAEARDLAALNMAHPWRPVPSALPARG